MRTAPQNDVVPPYVVARKLYKPKRAAAILDISIRQLYYLEQKKKIELVREGRSCFVVAASLDDYVERLRAKAAAARTKEPA